MTLFKTGLLACCLYLFAHNAARADEDFSKGLFWQVSPLKGQPSWLIGSIQAGGARVEPKIAAAEKLLASAQRLVLEMSRQERERAAQLIRFNEDAPFAAVLSVEMNARTRAALLARGVNERDLDTMPAWVAILKLGAPAVGEPGMDMRLLQKAAGLKRPVFGLETARDQLQSLRDLPAEVQQVILTWQVTHMDELNYGLSSLVDAYVSENLTRMVDLEFETSAPDTLSAQQQALVLDQLINQRNARMIESLQAHLKAGRALIAVGASHLPGMLHELDALGYTVQRLEM